MGMAATVVVGRCWVLGLAAIVVTVLPLLGLKSWWVRVWDFPRQQIVVVAALAALGFLVLRGWPSGPEVVLLAALAAAMVLQLAQILPYTRFWRRQGSRARAPSDERSFRVLIANVLMTNREVDRLVRILREADPDIVLLLEPDRWWVDRIAPVLPEHRFRVLHPLDNTYGMALLSRLELVEPELRFLLKEAIPSIRTRVRLRSGEEVLFYGVHPEPPSPTEADSSLPRDAELVVIGREIAKETRPVVVAGDLNDVAWSHTSRLFRRLSGLIDPRIGRGFYNTFHADYRLLRWPLDHVFYSADFLLRDLRRLPAFGSDHFPILIGLAYHPPAAAEQPVAAADREDRREAKETVAEAVAEEAR